MNASQEISRQAIANPDLQGMGSTCACAWIIAGRLYATSVGDSRIYLLRGNTILQLSTDHTWIQEAIDQGTLTPETARGHPNQHVIRRYLGSPVPPDADFRLKLPGAGDQAGVESNQGLPLREGDRLVMCSDGLTDLVDDPEILSAYREESLDEANRRLVSLANQRGGHDNITIVAIEIPRRAKLERLASSNRVFQAAVVATLLLALILFTGLVIGFDWLNNHAGEVQTTPTALTAAPSQVLPVIVGTQLQPSTLTPTPSPASSATPTPGVAASPAGGIPTFTAATATPWPTNTVQP
jgi:protein phosphatase